MASNIKTTVVGSYPAPNWLLGQTSKLILKDAIMVVFKTQELAGVDLIGDGELNRFDPSHPETNGMIDYFVRPMSGVKTKYALSDIDRFRADAGMEYRSEPAGVVESAIGEGTLNLRSDYEFIRPLTTAPLKFTCTGPHMLAKVLVDNHYGGKPALALEIAKILKAQLASINADVIQIDEANIPGHPEDAPWAAEALNIVFEGIKQTKALHICFGNYGGQTIQRGQWKNLTDFINLLNVDFLVLEFARRGYDELAALNDIKEEIGLGVGVIDIKDNEVESPDQIAKRIETIVDACGEGRLKYIHPDCGFWMLQRNVADRKMRALVEGRNLYEGSH
ncbi:MAG: cobalamin-independent methionine synthase II family protein [Candidatus Hinthialibacter antarcticus]|nr:cobalamin-independent methionine synthase II family protein [Candidatus Hinthialibacter antarcticus]